MKYITFSVIFVFLIVLWYNYFVDNYKNKNITIDSSNNTDNKHLDSFHVKTNFATWWIVNIKEQ